MKFLQVTDVHLTQNNTDALKNFVDEVNSKYKDIDFVVFTGDNIDKPNESDLGTFLGEIKNLHVKPYVILGNHDVYKAGHLSKDLYMKKVQDTLGHYHSNEPHFSFVKKDIVFVCPDGTKEVIPGANSYFKETELAWLDKELTKYKNKKVVIIQHYPLLDCKVKNHGIYNKTEYEKILAKHDNVVAIIGGHYHLNQEEKIGTIYNIVTKNFSDGKYYKLIEIDTNNDLIFTHLVENE